MGMFISLFSPESPTNTSTLLVTVALIVCVHWKGPLRLFGLGAIAGCLYVSSVGQVYLWMQLPSAFFQQTLVAEGNFSEPIYRGLDHNQTVEFKAYRIGNQNYRFPRDLLISVSPDQASYMRGGEYWRLAVKLSPAVAWLNPENTGYQAYLLSRQVVATGYIRESPTNLPLSDSVSLLQTVVDGIRGVVPDHQAKWLLALCLGQRGLLSDDDWEVLQTTGVAHLYALSGLHLGLLAALVYYLLGKLGKGCLGLCLVCHQLSQRWFNDAISISSFLARLSAIDWGRIQLALTLIWCAAFTHGLGYPLPLLRATVALMIWSYWRVHCVQVSSFSVLVSAVVMILVIAPFSAFGLSFWLSFVAVFALVVYFSTVSARVEVNSLGIQTQNSRLTRTVLIIRQFAIENLRISLLLLPMSAFFFKQWLWLSLFTNLLYVPLIGLLLLPLGLLSIALILMFPAQWFLPRPVGLFSIMSKWSIEYLSWVATGLDLSMLWLASLREIVGSYGAWSLSPNGSVGVAVLWLGILCFRQSSVLLLQSIGRRIRAQRVSDVFMPSLVIGVVLAIMILAHRIVLSMEQAKQRSQIIFFDVGQGLSVALRSRDKLALYDAAVVSYDQVTGQARYALQFAAEPFLNNPSNLGVSGHIEWLVISHSDSDHAGGLAFLEQNYVIKRQYGYRGRACVAGQNWTLGDFSVLVLWPLEKTEHESNNNSCVVMLAVHGVRVLLTGDMEREGELAMVQYYANNGLPFSEQEQLKPHGKLHLDNVRVTGPQGIEVLRADYIVSGHHGSRTSSTSELIRAVSPRHVIHAAGFQNRYGFPHPEVLERINDTFSSKPIEQYSVADLGAITIDVTPTGHHLTHAATDRLTPYWLYAVRASYSH